MRVNISLSNYLIIANQFQYNNLYPYDVTVEKTENLGLVSYSLTGGYAAEIFGNLQLIFGFR